MQFILKNFDFPFSGKAGRNTKQNREGPCQKTKQKKRHSFLKSLTPEERKDHERKLNAKNQRKWRAKKKAELGIDVYHELENSKRRKLYVKSADLPSEQLLVRRKYDRERKYLYRQKLKTKSKVKRKTL